MLLFVGVALALALLLVLLLPHFTTRFPGRSTHPVAPATSQVLHTGDLDSLTSITVTHREGETYTLLYQNECLFLKREGGAPAMIDEAYTDTLLKAATTIAVEDTVTTDLEEVQAHLGDMGLNPAAITVKVRYGDSQEETLHFGHQAPGSTHYYYRWSGADGLYMCDRSLYEAFEYTAAMLLPVDQPLLQKNLIDTISIWPQGQEAIVVSVTPTGGEGVYGMLQSPFAYPLDSTATDSLLTAAASFRLGTKQGPVTAENREDYGFNDPLAIILIHQQEGAYSEVDETGALVTHTLAEQSLSIVLGREEGDFFYTCEYEGECYLVSRFLVAALANASPDSLITRHPADMGSLMVATIQVQYGGTVLDIRQQRTEQVLENNQLATDSQGNTLYDISATCNGEPMEADAFAALVNRLGLMEVSAPVDEGYIPTGAPRWQLTLTTQGGQTRTLAAYALNPLFDALAVDGVVKHTLQAESLDTALADLP